MPAKLDDLIIDAALASDRQAAGKGEARTSSWEASGETDGSVSRAGNISRTLSCMGNPCVDSCCKKIVLPVPERSTLVQR
jgi:hypothetical protein